MNKIFILDELQDSGLLHQVTDRAGLHNLLKSQVVPVYAGYDPTSVSLHVGNLVPTILLRRLQIAGHKPIAVVGGATGMIGDPSGRGYERNLLDEAIISANASSIHRQLARLLDFDDSVTGAILVNNYDWIKDISCLTFLRDVGRHLTINYMTGKDSVASRLEHTSGISYTEFSYMLLQAYDFVHLSRTHGCRLQVGGSDQYGNITAGCELSRKMRGPELFGLTAPLLLDASGQKMGKTASGAKIWLDPTLTSPFQFYQYWFNRSDNEAVSLLRIFSLAPLGQIEEICEEHNRDRSKRFAQRELARAVTTWVHGFQSIDGIETACRLLFSNSLAGITDDQLQCAAAPITDISRNEFTTGIPFLDLLVRVGAAHSKGNARRLIEQNSVSLNCCIVDDVNRRISHTDLATETMLVIRKGRQQIYLIRCNKDSEHL